MLCLFADRVLSQPPRHTPPRPTRFEQSTVMRGLPSAGFPTFLSAKQSSVICQTFPWMLCNPHGLGLSNQNGVAVPARAAYSNSASDGSRYDLPVIVESHAV